MAQPLHLFVATFNPEMKMPSKNVGAKRKTASDAEVPAELSKREAQDRPAGKSAAAHAQSPVDAMHVDAPKKQHNARGHRARRES